jgi:large subunit ribosomal protein L18e
MKLNVENRDVKEWLDVLSRAAKEKRYAGLWKKVHYEVAVPSRIRSTVNLYKINKLTKDGDNVIVPGKVLSVGAMDHKVNIAAISYSSAARSALTGAKCSIIDIKDMIKMDRINLII